MPTLFKGADLGTYWHANDPRLVTGFTPQLSGAAHTIDQVLRHVVNGTTNSPYVSFTRAYGVALEYALEFGKLPGTRPSKKAPAYVYELDVPAVLPPTLMMLDPVQEIAKQHSARGIPEYHHNATPRLINAIVDANLPAYLNKPCPAPPNTNAPVVIPRVSDHLRGLICALRDAEVLILGTTPRSFVVARHDVW